MSRPALPLPVVLETVLTDANVLFSRVLRDYILYAAEEGLIAVAWSQQVLDDMAEHMMEKI
ncbi:MAG: hypothetical protein LBK72_09885, partial [Bifidobacteriaceae bacterium]|nr:hypothetical protein [Bifidobacteriaceae bacterium]